MVGKSNSSIKVATAEKAARQEEPTLIGGTPANQAAGTFPPTVIVRDCRENPKKCSILPLRGRTDLLFLSYSANLMAPSGESDLKGYIRLAPGGPELSREDAGSGLLLLDASWRRADSMVRAYQHIPARSLTGYQTAYPRVSKKGTDPANSLATVEALFLAYHILGRPTAGLLDHYRWAEEFLRLNNLPKKQIPRTTFQESKP